MYALRIFRAAAAALLLLSGFTSPGSLAQTAGTRIPVGTAPLGIAINPITNKIYVSNSGSDNITVINANTGATTTLTGGNHPWQVGLNTETNQIYVSNTLSGMVTVIDGSTDTVLDEVFPGDVGWMAINPITNHEYILRYGGADEVNVFQGANYLLTSATFSFQPTALAVNPTNNWIYMVNQATGDVAAMDMTTPEPYPPVKCPDGAGGFKAPYPAYTSGPCIDVPDTPVSVAINPLTNTIYALSTSASNQISVIAGANHTFTSLTPPGAPLTGAKVIAVNPVTNKVYAIFSTALVVIDGATLGMTVHPSGSAAGGPVAIGVNPLTNQVYVPNADGTLFLLNGDGSVNTVPIALGANAIAVNPLTNTAYILDTNGGVTPVMGGTGTATATGITASIAALPGNQSNGTGSIQINASSTMPAPLGVRRVYYRFGTTGPWQIASGSGPWTASFTGLAPGTYTIQAVATNSLEAPSINTDRANVPITSPVASYVFTVADVPPPPPPKKIVDFNADGKADLLFERLDGSVKMVLMNGASALSSQLLLGPGTGWSVIETGDFNGDGKTDILWQHTSGATSVWLMNGTSMTSARVLLNGGTGWTVSHLADLNGDGKDDLVWKHTSGAASAWLMNGTAASSSRVLLHGGTGWQVNHVADLNGDQKDDLVWRHPDGSSSAWLMNGLAMSSARVLLGAGTGWSITEVGDFNGDGKGDFVWAHSDGTTSMWLMNGLSATTARVLLRGGSGWSVTQVGDLNGDGKDDLLWRHTNSSASVWLMNGASYTSAVMIRDGASGSTIAIATDTSGDRKDDLIWVDAQSLTSVWVMNGVSTAGSGTIQAGGEGWLLFH